MTTAQFLNLLDSITALETIEAVQEVILNTRIELARAQEDRDVARQERLSEVLTVAQGQANCIIEATGKED